jgi:hypothetical protein
MDDLMTIFAKQQEENATLRQKLEMLQNPSLNLLPRAFKSLPHRISSVLPFFSPCLVACGCGACAGTIGGAVREQQVELLMEGMFKS